MPELIVERSGDLLALRLSRPDRANALGPELVEELIGFVESPGSARLITIAGEGKLFCAGFDLGDADTASDGDLLQRFVRVEHLLQSVHHSPIPIACFAHRHAVGAGADLLVAAHHRVIAPGTKIRMPGLNFDLTLGVRRLTRLIGSDAARDVLLDTRAIDAVEAEEVGLVSHVAGVDRWDDIAAELLERTRSLAGATTAAMLSATASDTRAVDMASLVASASTPGLARRICNYRESLKDSA